jgi:3D (Asp-Asp-Asp) domain-containing protein
MKRTAKRALISLTVGMSIAAFATTASAAEYTVKPNDTFWKLAQGHDVSLNKVLAANEGIPVRNLQIGQTVEIPGAKAQKSGGTYLAKEGDTFWVISRKLNLPLTELIAANPKVQAGNIYKGLVLHLPAGQKPIQALTVPKETASLLPSEPASSYSKVLDVVATAYSGAAEENGGWANLDYFGNTLKVGTIAVDPKVIPLGTKVYITGYNSAGLPAGGMTAVASDVGSAIKGNRVDIFLPGSRDQVSKFGMQNVKVHVLK